MHGQNHIKFVVLTFSNDKLVYYVHSKVSLLIALLNLVFHLEYNCNVWYLLIYEVKVVHYCALFRDVGRNAVCW